MWRWSVSRLPAERVVVGVRPRSWQARRERRLLEQAQLNVGTSAFRRPCRQPTFTTRLHSSIRPSWVLIRPWISAASRQLMHCCVIVHQFGLKLAYNFRHTFVPYAASKDGKYNREAWGSAVSSPCSCGRLQR